MLSWSRHTPLDFQASWDAQVPGSATYGTCASWEGIYIIACRCQTVLPSTNLLKAGVEPACQKTPLGELWKPLTYATTYADLRVHTHKKFLKSPNFLI